MSSIRTKTQQEIKKFEFTGKPSCQKINMQNIYIFKKFRNQILLILIYYYTNNVDFILHTINIYFTPGATRRARQRRYTAATVKAIFTATQLLVALRGHQQRQ